MRNTLLILFAAVTAAALGFVVFMLFSAGEVSRQAVLDYLPALLICLFSLVSCLFIYISFRNTASSEIFFFYIFIFSLIFDIFKLEIITDGAISLFAVYSMVPTRLVYYGLLTGTLALFSAGLFTTGLEYQRMEIATVIILVLPAALVAALPVDVSSAIPGGTWEIGRFREVTAAVAIFATLAVLSFVIAGIKNESREYKIIAAGLAVVVAGRALTFYFSDQLLNAGGFLLLIAGTIFFARKTHKLYLWD